MTRPDRDATLSSSAVRREPDGTGVPSRHMPPKAPSCAICTSRIPLSSIRSDAEAQHPRFGQHRPGQQTISCSGCGRLLHTGCVDEAFALLAEIKG